MRISRRMLLSTLTAGLIGLLILQSAPAGKGGGGKPGGGGGGTTQLPNVRYRIQFAAMPDDATGGALIDNMNNWGHVVGWYLSTGDIKRPFLYAPSINPDQAIDINTLVTGGVPTGWRVASGVHINDWMVVVGYMENIADPNQRRPIAIDLLADKPVVDLLPDLGLDYSFAKDVNENGDILGVYQAADGSWAGWIFNPGLYGNPLDRQARDGTPIDMSAELPDPLFLSSRTAYLYLNNPVDSRPAQVAGTDPDGVPFRYTLGDSSPERFPQLDLFGYSPLGGLNDAGTFTSLLYVPREKKRADYTAPFRYNTALDELPPLFAQPQSINSSGDLLLDGDLIYRDDWKDLGYVNVDDLVVGTDADLAVWHNQNASWGGHFMNDRAGTSDSGQIVGRLDGVTAIPLLFLLTPEPAP